MSDELNLVEITKKAKIKRQIKEQKLFDSCVKKFTKTIEKGCKKEAKRGSNKYILNSKHFREKYHGKYDSIVLYDVMFPITIKFLMKNNIHFKYDGFGNFIFTW